jgi:hypothetical protein
MGSVKTEASSIAARAEKLQALYTGSRVRFHWLGQSRKIEKTLHRKVENLVKSESVRATTRLYNWERPCLAQLNSCRTAVKSWWRSHTAPYIEEGVRLLPRTQVHVFEEVMAESLAELQTLAQLAQEERDEILQEAQVLRGRAFDLRDYPEDLSRGISLDWRFQDLEPPKYLKKLSESAYAADVARHGLRMAMAVELAEESFARELKDMVDNLLGKLDPPEEGKRTIIKDAAVENLHTFFSRFAEICQWGADDLEEIVEEAKEVMAGIDPEDLRRSKKIKKDVGEGLSRVSEKLSLMVGENNGNNNSEEEQP